MRKRKRSTANRCGMGNPGLSSRAQHTNPSPLAAPAKGGQWRGEVGIDRDGFPLRLVGRLFVAVLVMGAWADVHADEGGSSFWLPGQYASFAAVPASPGWSLSTDVYFYSGGVSASETFSHGQTLSAGEDMREALLLLSLAYAPEAKVLGGQPSLSIGGGSGGNRVQADLSVSSRGTELHRSDTDWGFTDLNPTASLAWNRGVHNGMVYFTGNIPVGSYNSQRLANIGLGFWAVDAGGGYTYYDSRTGWEFSAVIGFTYNFQNSSTDCQNGIDSHLAWSVSKFLSAAWSVGIAGYVYYQLAGDSGNGDTVGPFKSRVAAVGPQVGLTFKVGNQQWVANLRWYNEFWAENRYEGYALFATLNIPLSSVQSR